MTTPKLDEARQRELAEMRLAEDARMLTQSYANGDDRRRMGADISTVLDALSAERERGDRAVGLLRRAAGIAMVDGWATREMTRNARDTVDEAHAFLATQKAEGA